MAESIKTEMRFPVSGLDLSRAFAKQPNRPTFIGTPQEQQMQMGPRTYSRTTAQALNVRGYEPSTQRKRGGSRPGLLRYNVNPLVQDWIVQHLNTLTGVGFIPPGVTVQPSASGRIVTLVAVSQGNIYVMNPGDLNWFGTTNMTGETPPLNFTGLMQSTQLNQKLWIVDGTNMVYYDPSLNTVNLWVASQGQLPVDADGNYPTEICTWRGRAVLSGLIKDPQNWFMSAVLDPTNFNYAGILDPTTGETSTSPTQAIAGNNAPQGLIGDVVTNLIPWSDDVLIFGGNSSIYAMRGDPLAGGQIDRISDAMGIAFGPAWAKDPQGNLYFFSNRNGIYIMQYGSFAMQRISQPIDQNFQNLTTGTNNVLLLWDHRNQGLRVFITPLAAPGVSTHFFWDQRANAWWQDQFGSTNLDPLCGVQFDGNTPADRYTLIGSWDGYVRALSLNATDDDGIAIASSVVIGPIDTNELDEVMLEEMLSIMGTGSGQVTYQIYKGTSPEAALSSTAVASGILYPGRNFAKYIRQAGHAIYIKLSASVPWSMEVLSLDLHSLGKVRRRGA